jgi:hypothetical protein
LGNGSGIVVAEFISVTTHDPVVVTEPPEDFLMDDCTQTVIGLVGDTTIPLM